MLGAIKAQLDPDRHREFYASVARQNVPGAFGWIEPKDIRRRSHQQIEFLHKSLRGTVPAVRQIGPQAWMWLRMAALAKGVALPSTASEMVRQLEALQAAARELARPPVGRPIKLTLERAIAGACASVYWRLAGECPTLARPDRYAGRPNPYHALVEAVFEWGELKGWEQRAVSAAKELHVVIGGINPLQNSSD
jgi:hypothetical protein